MAQTATPMRMASGYWCTHSPKRIYCLSRVVDIHNELTLPIVGSSVRRLVFAFGKDAPRDNAETRSRYARSSVRLSQRQTPATSCFLQTIGSTHSRDCEPPCQFPPAKRNGVARFIQSTSCARALRARALRCLSARLSHLSLPPSARCLEHRSCQRARCNCVAHMHRAAGHGIARERYAQPGYAACGTNDRI